MEWIQKSPNSFELNVFEGYIVHVARDIETGRWCVIENGLVGYACHDTAEEVKKAAIFRLKFDFKRALSDLDCIGVSDEELYQKALTKLKPQISGLLLDAGDDSRWALACAYANNTKRTISWCQCLLREEVAYWMDKKTGAHGWMCCFCFRTTQVG